MRNQPDKISLRKKGRIKKRDRNKASWREIKTGDKAEKETKKYNDRKHEKSGKT